VSAAEIQESLAVSARAAPIAPPVAKSSLASQGLNGVRMKVAVIFGTRPEAIKMAPVVSALRAEPGVETSVWSTGQHREMLDQVMDLFHITADLDLKVMAPDQTLNGLFSRVVSRLEDVFAEERPDRVLVHGDTTTAAAAATAAFHRGIPIGHVEAGLRSGRMDQPWPEEFNRRLVDLVADHLYAPTTAARDNLLAENLGEKHIVVTGNTVVDALLHVKARIDNEPDLQASLSARFPQIDPSKRLVLVTGHRRENFGDGFLSICKALLEISQDPDVQILYPVHLNPNVQRPVMELLSGRANISLIEPVDYLAFVYLMGRSTVILTDSGGVQEEAPSLGKPVLVMRDVTERPEAVAAGVVRLVGAKAENIVRSVREALQAPGRTEIVNPYGDGKAAARIVQEIVSGS
jgi:UDP-N-acetylglucosamine 2-epimerase (non-hydrolysing)